MPLRSGCSITPNVYTYKEHDIEAGRRRVGRGRLRGRRRANRSVAAAEKRCAVCAGCRPSASERQDRAEHGRRAETTEALRPGIGTRRCVMSRCCGIGTPQTPARNRNAAIGTLARSRRRTRQEDGYESGSKRWQRRCRQPSEKTALARLTRARSGVRNLTGRSASWRRDAMLRGRSLAVPSGR